MKTPSIYVIGDSISIQYGPFLEAYLRGVYTYARKSGMETAMKNLDVADGANGGDSGKVLSFLLAMREPGGIKADVLLLNCGLHDVKTDPLTGAKQVALAQYRKNLKAIVSMVPDMGLRLVWVRTTPCDEAVHNQKPGMSFHRFAADILAYNTAADKIMRGAGIDSIDLYTFTLNLGPDLYCDHVHFHDHIRQKQAAYMAGWLQSRR